MQPRIVLLLGSLLAASCVLPDVAYDPNAGSAGKGAGGGAGRGGSAGTAGTDMPDREKTCLNYCQAYFQACASHPANTYDDETDCVLTCGTADWPIAGPATSGSLSCRLVHASLAVTAGPNPHCYHSAEFPSMGSCD